jgi:hypothetical protein
MASSKEKDLWCAVILQAIEDAIEPSQCPAYQRSLLRDQARIWLTHPNKHFRDVCNLAGMDAEQVRTRAKLIIAEADAKPTKRQPKRSARTVECNGLSMTLPEWAKLSGISEESIRSRISRGWSFEEAISIPAGRKRRPGVVKDFQENAGTGGGCSAQVFPEIEFFSETAQ